MLELVEKAGLSAAILKDPSKRALAIDEYNAKAGGLRGLMRAGKLSLASTHPIPSSLTASELSNYLKFIRAGKRIPIVFAAGRATRMKLPAVFDRLGIAGLTGGILAAIDALREGDEAPTERLLSDARLKSLIDMAGKGECKKSSDLSFLQRQLLQYRYQTEDLFGEDTAGFSAWLEKAPFAVIANSENKDALAAQMAGIRFAGLRAENIFMMVQPEAGGVEVMADGGLRSYKEAAWPEGHGKPFLDMRSDPGAALGVDASGRSSPLKRTFVDALSLKGVERAVFAQVNDLHLLEDMTHAERWLAADSLIAQGSEMVMEMVANGIKQKGGGIFLSPDGNTVMRDTIAMKSKDLELYAVPQSLSRMFYELTLSGLAKLDSGALPAYIAERKTSDGRTVLTREFYSGDASGRLHATAIQQKGYALHTFKVQSRIPEALQALQKQDSQPGFMINYSA